MQNTEKNVSLLKQTLKFMSQNTQRLTVLSYGGGQDSTAILYKLINDNSFREKYVNGKLIVVMSNTRNEHGHTYRYLKKAMADCQNNGIPFYLIEPNEYASGSWTEGLIPFYEKTNTVGSKAFPKTCTDNLKIRPIYRFLESWIHEEYQTEKVGRKRATYQLARTNGKIRVLIGIAKGEEKRASPNGSSGMKWFDECIEKVYPLIEEGMDRDGCQQYIKSLGHEVPFPSNCILCPFMSSQELLYLYRFNRKWFDKWVQLEQAKIDNNLEKGDKNFGVWGSKKLLPEVLREAEEKHGHMTDDELIEYKMSHGHCVMSKY